MRDAFRLAQGVDMIPDFLTRADWEVPVQAAATVVEEVGGFGIDDVEGLLKMAERFEGAFMRVGNKIMEMRKFEENGGQPNVVEVDPDRPQGGQMQATPATGSGTFTASQITADKVYSVLLGALNQAQKTFPEMTAGEMLVRAREMKALIVPEIEAQLIKMATPPP